MVLCKLYIQIDQFFIFKLFKWLLESSRNITFNTRDADGFLENQLFLGHDKLDIVAKKFKVSDPHGSVLFSVDKEAVVVGANSLRIEGDGGAIFRESIQSPIIRSEAGKDLK